MPAAALPLNEADRLRALHDYKVLDTPEDPVFQDIVRIASVVCDTPMATISLVDSERQWFLARVGVADQQTPRDAAFCAHTILEATPLIVGDALEDPRFSDSPLVRGEPRIRFYAGAPLITPSGHELGALCAIDRKPRVLTPTQIEVLESLARLVVAQLERRRVSAALADALSRARSLSELVPICAWCRRIRDDANYWSAVEMYLRDQLGAQFSHSICPDCAGKYKESSS